MGVYRNISLGWYVVFDKKKINKSIYKFLEQFAEAEERPDWDDMLFNTDPITGTQGHIWMFNGRTFGTNFQEKDHAVIDLTNFVMPEIPDDIQEFMTALNDSPTLGKIADLRYGFLTYYS
jgi:hypothetical protein